VRAKEGITADPEKVNAILQTKKPDLSTELRSFIGQCEYQRKFIPCLYEYLAPLRAIVQDLPYKTPVDISDRWDDESSNAFDTLKVALAQDTVLRFPDFSSPFIIVVDTSKKRGWVQCCVSLTRMAMSAQLSMPAHQSRMRRESLVSVILRALECAGR
jgi:hypothetical protein